jgi:hypothetical protein
MEILKKLVVLALATLAAGLVVTILFVLSGLYALAGANTIRRLPLLRSGLVAIGVIYALRGLFLLPELLVMAGVLPSSRAGTTPGRAFVAGCAGDRRAVLAWNSGKLEASPAAPQSVSGSSARPVRVRRSSIVSARRM